MKKKIFISLIILTAVIMGGYLWLNNKNQESQTLRKMTLGAERSLLPAAVWIAEHKATSAEKVLT